MYFGIFLTAFSLMLSSASTSHLPDLHWNSSNPLFRDLTRGGPEIYAQLGDSLVIRCPTFNDSTPKDKTEQLVIYRVSRQGYENCFLDDAKVVGRCVEPYVPQTIRTTFRGVTPLPGGLEYKAGRTYYFITTSDGKSEGMNLTAGGLCMERHLKLKIHLHNQRHPHGRKRNHHTSTKSTDDSLATDKPQYWDEFMHKLPRTPDGSRQNRVRETIALDSNARNNQDEVAYERSDASKSEALRRDPTIFYEIHEFDEYSALTASAQSICVLRISVFSSLFILIRILLL